VAWILFLLAAKSSANRDLLARLQRTSVIPLAQQLENAEKCSELLAQQEQMAAEVAATSKAAPTTACTPSSGVGTSSGGCSSGAASSRISTAGLPAVSPFAELATTNPILPVSTPAGSMPGSQERASTSSQGADHRAYRGVVPTAVPGSAPAASVSGSEQWVGGTSPSSTDADGQGARQGSPRVATDVVNGQVVASSDMDDDFSMLAQEVLLLGGGAGPPPAHVITTSEPQ